MAKKIKFSRTDSHKKKKLGDKWRKPKGIQNKRRLRKRGYARVVKKGYRSPNKTRGLRNGLEPVRISNLSELKALDKKTQSAIVSSTIGNRKRLEILEEAKKMGVTVENLKTDSKIKQIKEFMEQKQKEKKDKEKKKQEEEKKKKKDKEKTIDESVKKEEDKQKEDKKEKVPEKEKKESKDSKKQSEETKEETKEETDEEKKKKKEYDKLLTKKQ